MAGGCTVLAVGAAGAVVSVGCGEGGGVSRRNCCLCGTSVVLMGGGGAGGGAGGRERVCVLSRVRRWHVVAGRGALLAVLLSLERGGSGVRVKCEL